MEIIIVSDIFGKTKELSTFAESLDVPFVIIDPYSGKEKEFTTESEAYAFFMENVALQAYSEVLKEVIGTLTMPSILLGFSIGATAIWRISANLNHGTISRAICFYSSQIRNFMSITPSIETELIFPQFEPTFSVPEISECLSKKKQVNVHRTPYLHGFMNKRSNNFSQSGFRHYSEWLRSIIRER